MRNISHHILVVSGHDKESIKTARSEAITLFKQHMEAGFGYKLVGEIMESLINNYYTFVVYPDGSKEGHETSEDGDVVRKKIIEFIQAHNLKKTDLRLNYAELQFGDDLNRAQLLHFG